MSRDYVKFATSLILFGSNGIIAAQMTVPSYELVCLRTLIGAALLVVVCLATGHRFTFLRYPHDAAWVIVSGLAMGASWVFLYEAYRLVGVGVSSLAYYCAPVMVMALSPFLFGERIAARRAIGFIVVFVGAILVSVQAVEGGDSLQGMFCGWMSAVMHAAMVVASKKADCVDGLENSATQLTASFVLAAVYVAVFGKSLVPVPLTEWPWAIVLGLINTGLGCYLYFSSYGGLSVQSVAILGYLEPLSAVAMAAVLLGEALSLTQLFGAVLILGGAIFGELSANSSSA